MATYRNIWVMAGVLWLGTPDASMAQIPRKAVRDLSGEAREVAKTSKQLAPSLPEMTAPVDASSPLQNLTVAPVISPGNVSATAPSTLQGASSGVSTTQGNNTGKETESALVNRLQSLEVDPTSENLIDPRKGAVWNIFDHRGVDARYERYLNLSAVENRQAEEYLARVDRLLELLYAGNPYVIRTRSSKPDRQALAQAYQNLRELGKHPDDHGLAKVIANSLDAVHSAFNERRKLYAEAARLETEIKRLEWNQKVSLENELEGSLRKENDQDNPMSESRRMLIAARTTQPYTRRLLRTQTQQASKIAQAEAKLLLIKGEFQALLVQLFMQRRFQHVMIGSAFYSSVFDDGELQIQTEGKLTEVLNHTGTTLTVSTLESLATEAIRDVRHGIAAVSNMMKEKRIQGGEKRLMETYFLGEHLPDVLAFPTDWRRTVLQFRQLRREATKAIEIKDYNRAMEKNTELSAMASDYDAAPIASIVSAAQMESNLHLAKARNAATSGDQDTMEKEVRAAASIWPQNPDLKGGAEAMMAQFNQQAQSLQEFDRLLSEGELRKIEGRREMFTAAVVHDEKRQKQLRTVLSQLLEIEKAIEQAKEYDLQGLPAQAWALVEEQSRKHPSDPKLLSALSTYVGKAPDFVESLLKARQAAAADPVAALNRYLLTLKHNPACKEAMEAASMLAQQQLENL